MYLNYLILSSYQTRMLQVSDFHYFLSAHHISDFLLTQINNFLYLYCENPSWLSLSWFVSIYKSSSFLLSSRILFAEILFLNNFAYLNFKCANLSISISWYYFYYVIIEKSTKFIVPIRSIMLFSLKFHIYLFVFIP